MAAEWTWLAVDAKDRVLVSWTDKRGACLESGDLGFLTGLARLERVSLLHTRASEACRRHLGGRPVEVRRSPFDWAPYTEG